MRTEYELSVGVTMTWRDTKPIDPRKVAGVLEAVTAVSQAHGARVDATRVPAGILAPPADPPGIPAPSVPRMPRRRMARGILMEAVLRETVEAVGSVQGNVDRAAAMLGVGPSCVHQRLQKARRMGLMRGED